MMSEKKIFIEIIGPDAEECADELAQIIQAEFETRPEKYNPSYQNVYEDAGKKMDPVVFGAIVGAASAGLAVPAAILATMQIKERLAKKQSFERLIEKGKTLKKTKQVTTIRFRIGPVEMEVEKATFAEISDLSN